MHAHSKAHRSSFRFRSLRRLFGPQRGPRACHVIHVRRLGNERRARQVGELVRLSRRSSSRRALVRAHGAETLSRERLSNGLSLRFAYGRVRKSANDEPGGTSIARRCIGAGREDDAARVLSRLRTARARSAGADNALRGGTITPIRPGPSHRYRIAFPPSSIPFYCLSTATAVCVCTRGRGRISIVEPLVTDD